MARRFGGLVPHSRAVPWPDERRDDLKKWLSEKSYRHLRANFTYDVIPIALFQAQIYVTLQNEVQM